MGGVQLPLLLLLGSFIAVLAHKAANRPEQRRSRQRSGQPGGAVAGNLGTEGAAQASQVDGAALPGTLGSPLGPGLQGQEPNLGRIVLVGRLKQAERSDEAAAGECECVSVSASI